MAKFREKKFNFLIRKSKRVALSEIHPLNAERHDGKEALKKKKEIVAFMFIEVRLPSLASLSAIAGSAADPAANSADLSVHRGVVGATATHTPGSDTIDGAANAQRATRVTLCKI